jgi:Domain of unknown function (DUF4190)
MTSPQDPNEPDPSDSPFATPATPPDGQPPPPPPPYGQQPPQYGGPPYGGPPQYGQPPYGGPPQYGGPPYGGPPQYGQPQYGGYPAAAGTNGFAIASLVCAFLCSPLGLVFGLIAKSQIKQRGQGGSGLATAGIVVSIVLFILGLVLVATGHSTFHGQTNNP